MGAGGAFASEVWAHSRVPSFGLHYPLDLADTTRRNIRPLPKRRKAPVDMTGAFAMSDC
jgi:hypothetical protein